jgi:hypothetical protein
LHPLCSWPGYGPGEKKEQQKVYTDELHNFYPPIIIINIVKSKYIYVLFPDTVLRHILRELMELVEKHVTTLITIIPISNLGIRLAVLANSAIPFFGHAMPKTELTTTASHRISSQVYPYNHHLG